MYLGDMNSFYVRKYSRLLWISIIEAKFCWVYTFSFCCELHKREADVRPRFKPYVRHLEPSEIWKNISTMFVFEQI